MKLTDKKCKDMLDVQIFGTTSLGARGQIVIPKEARDSMGYDVGDKFVVMKKMGCIVLVPEDVATRLAKQMTDALISK